MQNTFTRLVNRAIYNWPYRNILAGLLLLFLLLVPDVTSAQNPTISELSPSCTTVGTGVSLTISGAGFRDGEGNFRVEFYLDDTNSGGLNAIRIIDAVANDNGTSATVVIPGNDPVVGEARTLYIKAANRNGQSPNFRSSNAAAFTVLGAPTATQQCNLEGVTLAAFGAPSSAGYQWYAPDGTPIAGATESTYTIENLEETAVYAVSITTAGGCESTRTEVTANPDFVPDATITPSGALAICPGTTLTLAAAEGEDYQYQWYNGNASIPNATDRELQVTEAGNYVVVIRNQKSGCFVESEEVGVTVNALPLISDAGQPTASAVCGTGTATFTVDATGGGELLYQWFKRPPGQPASVGTPVQDGIRIHGALTKELTINNVEASDAGLYYAVVTGACSVSSNNAALVVSALPQPQTVTPVEEACVGGGTSVPIGLESSESGVRYQLVRNGFDVPDAVVDGTGGAISFGNLLLPGSYTIRGTRMSAANVAPCTQTISGPFEVLESSVVADPTLQVVWNSTETAWTVTALEEDPEPNPEKAFVYDFGDDPTYIWYRRESTSLDVSGEGWKVVVSGESNMINVDNPGADTQIKVEIRNAGTCTQYILHTIGVTPSPVEIIYLNASKQGNDVVLEWATAMEQDNAGFEVQVSNDGFNYRLLTFVPSKNATTSIKQVYTFTDRENGKHGTRYYRLKQVDTNGTFEFFGPKVVSFGGVASKVIAYPNPFRDEVTLDIAAEAGGEMLLVLTDAAGRQLMQRKVAVDQGFTTEKLKLDAGLPRGLYILKAHIGGQTQYLKLVKE